MADLYDAKTAQKKTIEAILNDRKGAIADNGVGPSFISRIVTGRIAPSEKLMRWAGFERVYKKIENHE